MSELKRQDQCLNHISLFSKSSPLYTLLLIKGYFLWLKTNINAKFYLNMYKLRSDVNSIQKLYPQRRVIWVFFLIYIVSIVYKQYFCSAISCYVYSNVICKHRKVWVKILYVCSHTCCFFLFLFFIYLLIKLTLTAIVFIWQCWDCTISTRILH